MARAHMEAPKAEEPIDASKRFDLSDTPREEAPKRRAKSSPPVPVEAYRPRRKKKDVSSEGKLSASVSGEISAKEESPYEEMTIEEAPEPTASQKEAMSREELRFETIEAHDRFQDAQLEYERLADAVDRRAKEIAADLSSRNFPADTILVWTEAISKREGLQEKLDAAIDKMIAARKDYLDRYEKWESGERANAQASAEMEKTLDEFIAQNQPASASFTEQEESWFKKGEEDEAKQLEEARATIERGGAPESLVETPSEIDANVRKAEAMVASGELNPSFFNANDYRYQLNEKARLDRELETAGWWQARKLRSELKEVQGILGDYEQQIQSVINERADSRDKAAWAAKSPEAKKAETKKRSLWSRIVGDR